MMCLNCFASCTSALNPWPAPGAVIIVAAFVLLTVALLLLLLLLAVEVVLLEVGADDKEDAAAATCHLVAVMPAVAAFATNRPVPNNVSHVQRLEIRCVVVPRVLQRPPFMRIMHCSMVILGFSS
jgi:hypothetical protein